MRSDPASGQGAAARIRAKKIYLPSSGEGAELVLEAGWLCNGLPVILVQGGIPRCAAHAPSGISVLWF